MDPSLITKYFSGRCSDKELEKVLDWFQTQKGRVFLREQIQKDCRRLTENKEAFRCRDIDTATVFNRILNSIKADNQLVRKDDTGRINKRLSFENEPLWKVSRQLERVYDVNIKFRSEQLKELNLSAVFKQKKAEVTLQAIATMLDIECEKASNSNYIWLKPPDGSL